MKKLILLALLSVFTLSQAQNSTSDLLKLGTITGKVVDATLNEPLPYVTVVVKNQNQETLTGSISDDKGEFKVTNLPEGKLFVSIQFIGYKTQTRELTLTDTNSKIDLGTITLEEQATGLDEVTVVAEVSTIQQKIDRKVITVGKDLTTAGATASDIMNNIPSVNVDQQSGEISLRGNENVRVMVDGKLSNVPIAQLLKQIPSTSIKQIELITNPSAKYNPEGMSGIINIILHKNTNIGFNGNINLGLTKEIFAKFNSSIDMNYRNGKFNFYGNYGNNVGKYDNFGYIDRTDDNSSQDFSFNNNNKSHLYKVGVDFYLDDRNTFSVFTNQNLFDGLGFGNTLITNQQAPFTQNQLFYSYSSNTSSQYNFAYHHNFAKEGEKIDLEIDYNTFDQDEDAEFRYQNFDFPPNYNDFVDTHRDQTTINLDYVNPLTEDSKLEAGLEARLFNTDVDYSSTGLSVNPQQDETPNNGDEYISTPSTDFSYRRDIYSAYLTYGKTLEKWSYQIGARAETVTDDAKALNFKEDETETIPFKNEYFQLYPSAYLTYNPTEKNTYQLSYSRRVDRPGLGQVNPIREWSTPRVSSYGNTELQPQFTNSIELNYTRTLNKGAITTGIFYRIIEDQISRVVFIDRINIEQGSAILSYDNFDTTTAFGIEVNGNYRPTKWWNFNTSFDLYSRNQNGITEYLNTPEGQTPTVDDIVREKTEASNIIWNIRMFNNFKVNDKLSLSLFAMYRGEEENVQLVRKPMYFVNTGLRYNFIPNATISFNYSDIFNTMRFEFDADTPYPSVGQFNWESNTWNVALSYRFGGNKYRALQRKTRDDNEASGSGGFL
ncbi:MAG TPA: TonB-dependent receptor [Flavobacteriaceae bacterium]|nr:TonB-dependent receptor [Flavobacteriaceae bacterium]